jgi:hypothetical protein
LSFFAIIIIHFQKRRGQGFHLSLWLLIKTITASIISIEFATLTLPTYLLFLIYPLEYFRVKRANLSAAYPDLAACANLEVEALIIFC